LDWRQSGENDVRIAEVKPSKKLEQFPRNMSTVRAEIRVLEVHPINRLRRGA
jgi:hypothetical protein